MNPCFKITFKTTESELFELTIPNAFDFDESVEEHVSRINTAAQNILAANAIETNELGDLSSIESIVFVENEVTAYDVS